MFFKSNQRLSLNDEAYKLLKAISETEYAQVIFYHLQQLAKDPDYRLGAYEDDFFRRGLIDRSFMGNSVINPEIKAVVDDCLSANSAGTLFFLEPGQAALSAELFS